MSTFAFASQRVSQLSVLLHNPATVLPVFVRFQKVDQCLTIPVMDVAINGESVEAKTTDGAHSIRLETLLDIVVFRDTSGKSVFLSEFPTGGDLAAEERAMIELWDFSDRARFGVVNHRCANDLGNPHMNVDSQIDQEFNQCNEVINHRIAA